MEEGRRSGVEVDCPSFANASAGGEDHRPRTAVPVTLEAINNIKSRDFIVNEFRLFLCMLVINFNNWYRGLLCPPKLQRRRAVYGPWSISPTPSPSQSPHHHDSAPGNSHCFSSGNGQEMLPDDAVMFPVAWHLKWKG